MTTAACSWNLVSLERAFNENTTDFTLHVAANLSLHQTYVVRTAAFTKLGHGPFTQPLVFSMDPANMVTWDTVMVIMMTSLQVDTLVNPHLPDMDLDQLTSQTWFIAFIGSVVFVLVLLFILVMMMMVVMMMMMMMMIM